MNKFNILKTLIIILMVCLCERNLSAQIGAGGAIMAIDEKNLGAIGKQKIDSPSAAASTPNKTKIEKSSANNSSSKKTKSQTNQIITTRTVIASKKATPKSPTTKKYDGFVIGDEYTFFNFEIVQYVQPIHTIAAQNAGAKGLVQVVILIGENGEVLQAHARSGNKLLHSEAEKAALMTKFNKPAVYGKPARAIGFIVFRFGQTED